MLLNSNFEEDDSLLTNLENYVEIVFSHSRFLELNQVIFYFIVKNS